MMRAAIRPPTITMAKGRWESEPMPRERAAGKQAERGDEHGHHDGAQAQHGAFDRGIFDGVAAGAQLVDVFEHDDAGLHGDAEQRQESDAGGNAEMRAGEKQRQQAAERGHGDVGENQPRPFRGAEHGVENHENYQQGDAAPRSSGVSASVFGFRIRRPSLCGSRLGVSPAL